jgi:hypothetical protein
VTARSPLVRNPDASPASGLDERAFAERLVRAVAPAFEED